MNELPHEELLSGYLDGELEPSERAVVERMLRVNADARQLLDELQTLRETIRSLPRYKLCPPLPQRSFAEEVLRRAEREMLLQPAAHASMPGENHAPTAAAGAVAEQAGAEQGVAVAASAALSPATSTSREASGRSVSPRRTAQHGDGWKRLFAAGMVLAASVALMVFAQPGDRQDDSPMALRSLGPQIPTSARDLGESGAAAEAALEGDARALLLPHDKAVRMGAAGEVSPPSEEGNPSWSVREKAAASTGPALNVNAASIANDALKADAARKSNAATAAQDAAPLPSAVLPQAILNGLPASPPAPAASASAPALGEMQNGVRQRGIATLPAPDGYTPIISGGMAAGNSAIVASSPPADSQFHFDSLRKSSGQAMVVHVQVTEQGWQAGRFQELLTARQIAWREPESRSNAGIAHKQSNRSPEAGGVAAAMVPPAAGMAAAAVSPSGDLPSGDSGGPQPNKAQPAEPLAANRPAAIPLAAKTAAPGATTYGNNSKPSSAVADRVASRRADQDALEAAESLGSPGDIQLIYLDAPEDQLQALLVDLRSAASHQDGIASLTVTSPDNLNRQFQAAQEQVLADHAAENRISAQESAKEFAANRDAALQARNLAQMKREAALQEAELAKDELRGNQQAGGGMGGTFAGSGKGEGQPAAELGNFGKLPAVPEAARQAQQGFFGAAPGHMQASDADEVAPAESPLGIEKAQTERMEREFADRQPAAAPEGMALRLQSDAVHDFRRPDLHQQKKAAEGSPEETSPADERRWSNAKGKAAEERRSLHVEALFIIQIVPKNK